MNSLKLKHPITRLLLLSWLLWFYPLTATSHINDFANHSRSDVIAPTAICDEYTVVAIGQDGTATALASTFDDGSTDNVGITLMEVRRMDNPNCPGFDGTDFGPTVPFTCCDIGSIVMVEFRVSDAAGNTNSCMVEVEAQDKLVPVINCPANISILCTEYPNPNLTGEATASDNCVNNVSVTYNDISFTENDCGEGEITRVWTATAGTGQYSTSSCIQIISVTNPNYFEESDITWPLDYTATTCGVGIEPDDLPAPFDYPVLDEGNCNNVAVGHTDQILEFGGADACLKILRKWQVVDWCQAVNNPDPTQPGPGVWHYTQLIKIINSDAPTITNFNGVSIVDNFEAACGSTTATFEILADDDCTAPELLDYSWEFSNGLSGNTNSASGAFLNGNYSLTFTINDQCGNSVSQVHDFEVRDAKLPTPVCIFGISTVVMPSTGEVTIWASDFESGSSYDNCTAYDDLKFSFSPDENLDSLVIQCADIPPDGMMPIDIYVTDEEGNQDFCSTFVNMQDPLGACASFDAIILGHIENEYQESVNEVTVDVTNINGSINLGSYVTGSDGSFHFSLWPSEEYIITPEKDFNALNGVTTYDLVLISKHILGTELLDSPYKIIAADANRSGSVTALDLVKLRALILHIDQELENSEAWRFVPANYIFPDPNNPFLEEFPEFYQYENGNFDPANFIAMKVGDVNGTAAVNDLLGSGTRTFAGEKVIQIQNQEVEAGKTFTVDFKAKDFQNVEGFQFTLEFEEEKVEFVDVLSPIEGLNEKNFGFTKLAEGVITTSWNGNLIDGFEKEEVLFSLTFKAKSTLEIEDIFSISSRYTASEAYVGDNFLDVKLLIDNDLEQVKGEAVLYQNIPNPFKEETTINFYLPQSEMVTLKIYDVSGRILKLEQIEGMTGMNSKIIQSSDLESGGVLYYQLATTSKVITQRMIMID